VVWSISRTLFAVAIGYAAVGSALTVLFGRPLVWLNYNQLDKEADFRGNLLHVQANADRSALLHGEGRIGARLRRRFDDLAANIAADDHGESQPRLLHQRVQLPDPDHPGPGRGPALHPRPDRVRAW
jgi:hypothetical protein